MAPACHQISVIHTLEFFFKKHVVLGFSERYFARTFDFFQLARSLSFFFHNTIVYSVNDLSSVLKKKGKEMLVPLCHFVRVVNVACNL